MLAQLHFETLRPLKFAARWVSQRRFRNVANRWLLHPRGSYFISRGGHDIPPPVYANLALTNKCNLRCEICGSQKYLDQVGIVRRHMPLDRFEAVAATLFPFLSEVELNSQGDPLLYPHIETVVERINQYKCELKVQTNGTLFTDRIIELLREAYGIVMLSLDAVGARFDEVRQGGVWAKAEPNLLKFLRSRDPRRLKVGIYPTVTRRTLQDIHNVVQFAADNGVEAVEFHRYSPIENSFEEEPTPNELEKARDQLRAWLTKHGDCLEIGFDGARLNSAEMSPRRKLVASRKKHWIRALAESTGGSTYPMDIDMAGANRTKICSAPDRYVEIGIDGQISTCCRAQDVALGYATSVEEFADVWFGKNYDKIRRTLDRDSHDPLSLPNCEPCLRFFAPKEASHRQALKYDGSDSEHPNALDPNSIQVWHVDMIQKRNGYGYAFRVPPGIDPSMYELWENQKRLGPADSPLTDISNAGEGRYAIADRELFFSSSDNSDARKNDRTYLLRQKAQ
jgi:MoaA/NifB/PqqE/SkfB family radical SAM enzyme